MSSESWADGCRMSTPGLMSMDRGTISIIDAQGQVVTIETLIADTETKRRAGYQHICEEVINNSTILFIYPKPIAGRFHMRNVHARLDIGFFDHQGFLIHHETMDTYHSAERPIYGPDQPFQFALEAREGFFAARQLVPGISKLVMEGDQ